MLRFLRDIVTREFPDRRVQYYGLDICAAEIEKARALSQDEQGNVVCQYKCVEAESLAYAALPVDWACTLLMCVGHTLPHFLKWHKFREAILRLKPRLILLDFYQSWDAVVERLQNDAMEVIREPRHVTPDEITFLLSTCVDESQFADGGGAVLRRGIEKLSGGDIISTGVWTYQHHRASEWFRREVEECGYIRETAFQYLSGYGPMKAELLSFSSQKTSSLQSQTPG